MGQHSQLAMGLARHPGAGRLPIEPRDVFCRQTNGQFWKNQPHVRARLLMQHPERQVCCKQWNQI